LPTDSSRPALRMHAAYMNDHFAEMRLFDRESDLTGINDMLSGTRLTHNSPFLSRCDRMMAGQRMAWSNRGGSVRHLAAARTVGERAVAAGELSRPNFETIMAGMAGSDPTDHDRSWELQAEAMRQGAAMCRTLARRRWEFRGNQVLFTSDVDMNAFNEAITRIESLQREMRNLMTVSRDRANEALEETRARRSAP
jgi:hypothetical protein